MTSCNPGTMTFKHDSSVENTSRSANFVTKWNRVGTEKYTKTYLRSTRKGGVEGVNTQVEHIFWPVLSGRRTDGLSL